MTGQQWRASSQLQTACHSAVVWAGGDISIPHCVVTCMSRVSTKDAAFTTAVLQQTLCFLRDRFGLRGVRHCCFINDGAPPYRNMRTQSWCCTEALQTVRACNGTIDVHDKTDRGVAQTHWLFGCPEHGKSGVDSFFAVLRRRTTRGRRPGQCSVCRT